MPIRRFRGVSFILVLGCLAGVALLLFAGWSRYRDRLEREETLRLFQSGHFREAAPRLRKLLECQPNDLQAVKALAQISLSSDAPESAEPLLRHWAELAPEDVDPWKRLLELYREQKDFDAARNAAREVLAREPDNLTVQRRLAAFCINTGRFDEAEGPLRRCLEKQPGDRGLLLLLAEVKRGQGRNQEAEGILKQLLADDANDPAVLMTTAILYRETGRPEQAIPLLEKVSRQDPSRRRAACYQLLMALEQVGRKEDAERVREQLRYLQESQVLRELLPAQPNDPEVKSRLAEMLLSHGETEEGTRLLNEVLAHHPNYSPAQKLRARYLLKQTPDR